LTGDAAELNGIDQLIFKTNIHIVHQELPEITRIIFNLVFIFGNFKDLL